MLHFVDKTHAQLFVDSSVRLWQRVSPLTKGRKRRRVTKAIGQRRVNLKIKSYLVIKILVSGAGRNWSGLTFRLAFSNSSLSNHYCNNFLFWFFFLLWIVWNCGQVKHRQGRIMGLTRLSRPMEWFNPLPVFLNKHRIEIKAYDLLSRIW